MTARLALALVPLLACASFAASPVPAPPHAEAAASETESAVETRVYDLRAIAPRFDRRASAEVLYPRLYIGSADWSEDLAFDVEPEGLLAFEEIDAGSLMEVLVGAFEDELAYEGRSIGMIDENRMAVTAPPELHARLARLLTELEASFSGQQVIEVDVLSLPSGDAPPAGLAPGVADASQVQAALARFDAEPARGATHRSFTLLAEAGRAGAVDLTQKVPFIGSYSVEIAQSAWAVDPRLSMAHAGLRLAANATARPGGVQLALTIKHSTLAGEPQERELSIGGMLGVKEQGPVESRIEDHVVQDVRLLGRSLALNTWLPDGRALVIGSDLDLRLGGDRLLVVLRRAGGSLAAPRAIELGGERRLVVVDRTQVFPPRIRLQGGEDFDRRLSGSLFTQRASGPSDMNDDILYAVVGSSEASDLWERWREPLPGKEWDLGPWWLATTKAPFDAAGLAAMAAPEELVDLHFALRAGGASAPVATVNLPLRVGEEGAAVLGLENTLHAGYYVEVAQAAALHDPTAYAVFDGILLWARPGRAANGDLVVDVWARAQVRTRKDEELELGGFVGNRVEQFRAGQLLLDQRLVFPAGDGGTRRAVLGDKGQGADRESLALLVELR